VEDIANTSPIFFKQQKMTRVPVLLAVFLLCYSPTKSFSPRSLPLNGQRFRSVSSTSSTTACFSSFDYEYIPPNPNARPDEGFNNNLPSIYPSGTPAGMRGEAVRSALLSGRTIGWDLSEDALSMGGVLKIQGKGTKDFLNSKLTQTFDDSSPGYQEACLLDAKGRIVDRLRVCVINDETAFLLTSPGHTSQRLMERLEPFIFPMDQIELAHIDESFIFTIASTQREHAEKVLTEQMLPKSSVASFPSRPDECVQWKLNDGTSILVISSTGLPSIACVGYTLIFHGSGDSKSVGSRLWQGLIGDSNPEGPIAVGSLEYETLRIEAGQPAYRSEIGKEFKATPLELRWDETINFDKGCYLGQESVASILKNRRGPPRTLYSVVFDNTENIYESQSRGDKSDFDNLTIPPKAGQKLYALGSNEELLVGTLTSVAEADSTGDSSIVALALVRRADSVIKKMKKMDLEIFREPQDFIDVTNSSGMIEPPPLDPLDGLEVIIQGTFTVGTIKMIPSRRWRDGKNMFDTTIEVKDFENEPRIVADLGSNTNGIEDDDDERLSQIQAEAEKAVVEAETAAAEAQRKAEKMEMLKKRAEEAMAKRRAKKKEQ
jgi:folate-binding protein YgfZ